MHRRPKVRPVADVLHARRRYRECSRCVRAGVQNVAVLLDHVFELKKRWKVGAAAIVKRAYDLRLIAAVEYRQSFKYMSARNWRKDGEPHEPEFKGPELLFAALGSLGARIDLTT